MGETRRKLSEVHCYFCFIILYPHFQTVFILHFGFQNGIGRSKHGNCWICSKNHSNSSHKYIFWISFLCQHGRDPSQEVSQVSFCSCRSFPSHLSKSQEHPRKTCSYNKHCRIS